MAGKMATDGVHATGGPKFRSVKAYSEGAEYRLSGSAVSVPITNNPHSADVDSKASWDAGWNDANAGTIEKHVAGYDRVAPP